MPSKKVLFLNWLNNIYVIFIKYTSAEKNLQKFYNSKIFTVQFMVNTFLTFEKTEKIPSRIVAYFNLSLNPFAI